jgi:hypothetical protein
MNIWEGKVLTNLVVTKIICGSSIVVVTDVIRTSLMIIIQLAAMTSTNLTDCHDAVDGLSRRQLRSTRYKYTCGLASHRHNDGVTVDWQ